MKALRATLDNLSLPELKASLQSLYAASAHKDVLAAIDTSLVLVDQALVNTANGEYRQLPEAEGLGRAEAIAHCAGQLLRGRTPAPAILLLLPPADFVATRFAVGVSGEKLLRSALTLQAHTLIPACEEPLLLGLNGGSPEGVAVWYPTRQADALFLAFQAEGLLLSALMPRVLALPQVGVPAEEQLLADEDSSHLTQLDFRAGVIKTWLSVTRSDLQQEAFAAQWQSECARLGPAPLQQAKGLAFWTAQRQTFTGNDNYCFYPVGAEKIGRELVARKQRRTVSIAAAVLVGVLFLPFLNNWFQIMLLERSVADLREQSTAARQAQAEVYRLEEEWGAVAEYPRQNVGSVLLTLNELIDNALATFAISKGVVDITGFAQDPALLIEQLAEREEFFNVGQSRSSSGNSNERGDRFGIRFSVSGVDFPGYEEQYPATQQQ